MTKKKRLPPAAERLDRIVEWASSRIRRIEQSDFRVYLKNSSTAIGDLSDGAPSPADINAPVELLQAGARAEYRALCAVLRMAHGLAPTEQGAPFGARGDGDR